MGAIQGSINNMLGTVAAGAGIVKKLKTDTDTLSINQAKQDSDIAETQDMMERVQLQGQGMSPEDIKAYQELNAMESIGANPVSGDDKYKAQATLNGELVTDDQGKPIMSTYTHSQIKARLANKVSYQNALAKAAQDSAYRARVKLVLGRREGGNK